MATATHLIAGCLAATLSVTATAPADVPPTPGEWESCLTYDPDTGAPRIDPTCFFDLLVDRYRRISVYEDSARVTQVTQRDGEAPQRVETTIGCEINDGRLSVETPAKQVRRTVGLDVQYRKSSAMEAAELQYNVWLAPHMALRFATEPSREFRAGVDEGFTITDAEAITIDDRPMVHVEMTSGDGTSEDCDAQFHLYVNPDSMLVERVKGKQRLPDGGSYETTVDITPLMVENENGPAGTEVNGEPDPEDPTPLPGQPLTPLGSTSPPDGVG